ncbi:16S rRNA (adenine(1518)-N(6)/adenine(1519)-N(6))-dimethyltransferase, partial [Buchnera aphidicola]|nr:16S rRNA (adenine(1518)-N(6)/adenine(1519)-N(6))-dimethyltransferase [Buchnera aphidicola]
KNVTQVAFQQRRKMLHQSLKSLFSIRRLVKLGINPKLRAENISITQYCKLANYLYNKTIK